MSIADGWTNTDGVGSWVFDCTLQRAQIPALAPGRYNFVIEALTPEGAPEYEGETVIAWLWARTVKCPNPACGARMPLVSSFELSKKKDKRAWVEPVVDAKAKTVSFTVKSGKGQAPEPRPDLHHHHHD